MTRIAIITDTHFGTRNDKREFFDHFERLYHDFFTYLQQHGIKRIVHMGDLYENRKMVQTYTASKCRELFLQRIEDLGIETDIIAGNHDVVYKDTNQYNALHELVVGRYPHIKCHIDPALIHIDGFPVQLLPWISESNYDQSIEAIRTSISPILLSHLELKDFEQHRGIAAVSGMDHTIFNRFDLVCSGHYHTRSIRDNINYVGAFSEFSWNDYNDPRGFSILDLADRRLEFIPNKHTIFETFTYDDVNKTNMRDEINSMNFNKKFVKILVENKSSVQKFDLAFDLIAKQEPIDIKIVEGSMIVDAAEDDDVVAGEDTLTLLSKYIDGLELTIDPERMKAYMRDLYLEAIAVEDVE